MSNSAEGQTSVAENNEFLKDPNWRSVLYEWARRSDYQQLQVPPLSHYTDADGLVGICSTNALWATCAQYSNDRSEVTYAHSIAEAVTDEVFCRVCSPAGKEFTQLMAAMIGKGTVAQTDAYLTSFCESSDLLSQWRGYGRDAGFEIRFASLTQADGPGGSESLVLHTPLGWRRLIRKVEYDHDCQQARLRKVLERALAIVEDLASQHEQVAANVAILCSLEFTAWLHSTKHPKFKEEAEWRAIFFPDIKPQKPFDIVRAALSGTERPGQVYEHPEYLRFRTGRQHFVVPYCELSPVKGKLPITEVICGPGGHELLTARATRLLLASNGFSDVIVRNSDVPLTH